MKQQDAIGKIAVTQGFAPRGEDEHLSATFHILLPGIRFPSPPYS